MPVPSERGDAIATLEQHLLLQYVLEAQDFDDGSSDSSSSSSSDSDMDLSSSSSSSSSSDSDSESSSSFEGVLDGPEGTLLKLLGALLSTRYLNDRLDIPKQGNLDILLTNWKFSQPTIFRSYLRISPQCFDALVSTVALHSVFQNNSQNSQAPVEWQVAVALYRFGHYGNAASQQKVALWAGIGYGTVGLWTTRVITACCSELFRRSVIRWPSGQAKEAAKDWVAEAACPEWRDGCYTVDGTLVPLFMRPALFGNTWYDRKSNYSLNVQLISTPDLRIIDYGIGLPGSQHDATAWKKTRVPNEHEVLLDEGEWVWGDSAYPIETWCQAPYKKPEKDTPENTIFNYYVSKVRIRSEHCVGFLKGRWSSLRGLRIRINNAQLVQYAALWVAACIHLHMFALDHEDGHYQSSNQFHQEGNELLRVEQEFQEQWTAAREAVGREAEQARLESRDDTLQAAKEKREMLKAKLFNYLNNS